MQKVYLYILKIAMTLLWIQRATLKDAPNGNKDKAFVRSCFWY